MSLVSASSGSWTILPFGAEARLLRLAGAGSGGNLEARRAQSALARAEPGWDVVVGADSVLCVAAPGETVTDERVLSALRGAPDPLPRGRIHTIPVCYDGPDLSDVARQAGLSVDGVIQAHASARWQVELLGFLPGFAYLGEAPRILQFPRRAEPRLRVRRGSVALAARYCGIYPTSSPGGWHLIGRSWGPQLFDPGRREPFLFEGGDEVRFEPVTQGKRADPDQVIDLRFPLGRAERSVTVEAVLGLCTVQDAGRPGLLHRGVSASGPLDPLLWERTQKAVRNGPGHACLELFRGAVRLRMAGEHWVSVNGAPAARVAEGEVVSVSSRERAVTYVAFAGGLGVPEVLGSRATWVAAQLGGYQGRALRRGDWISTGADECARAVWPSVREPDLWDGAPFESIFVERGPDCELFGAERWDRFVSSPYETSSSGDRTGLRLVGAPVLRDGDDTELSFPMLCGAIQVPKSGQPIVLGPDHPATGGYPVIGIVPRAERAKLYQLVPGQQIHWLSEA